MLRRRGWGPSQPSLINPTFNLLILILSEQTLVKLFGWDWAGVNSKFNNLKDLAVQGIENGERSRFQLFELF